MTLIRIFIFFLSFSFSLFASSPTSLETKKLSVSFSIPAKSFTGTHEFHILNGVDVAGYYWKTSNDSEDVPDWSSERYNYRKTDTYTGNLTIINSSGEPTLLELSFTSSTTASCNLSFWSVMNGELVKESYTGTATVTLTDLVLSEVPIEYQVAEPSGSYAPASIAGGTLSAQDRYWSVYDESINFATDGSFTASITNDDSGSPLSASGTSYTFTKTGTNSATLSYTIEGMGYVFEYDFQFTGENAGIYSKYADYGGSTTDVTTGPFSFTGVSVPEQFVWEDYDDFSGSTLDTTKWDLSCFDGGNLPIISNGEVLLAGNTNSSWNDTIVTSRMLATNSNAASILAGGGQAHSVLEFKESDNIYGIELSLSLPNNVSTDCGIGLYAIDYNEMFNNGNEEASIRFDLDLWHGSGNPEAQVSWQNPSTGNGEKASSIIVSKGTPIKLAFIRNENEIEFFYNDQSIATGNYQNVNETFFIRAVSETGASFANSVDNVRVLRRSTTTTQPDPVTVVSGPNGQAVVVQIGEKYEWSDNLDGIILWMVHEDDDDGWFGATVQYVGGMQQGSIGLTDQVGSNLVVNHPYVIDENGMIKVTEDTAFQYYQVTAVENGVIITADGSSFPLSDTSRFFTTRAAAEEYYYSKVNPKDWMWFDHYPWVYSNEMQEWLYFYPSGSKLLYYGNKNQAWREFNQ
ncbi:MAG: hypothetical protein ACJZ7A_01425 [Opitutales bacterium]